MHQTVIKRLARHKSAALLGLFFVQYLAVVTGPALIILGFGIWNPFVVLAGLLSLRLLMLFIELQQAVMKQIKKDETQGQTEPSP